MPTFLIIGLIITLCLIIMFLYYKYKPVEHLLNIVPGSNVSTRLPVKLYYKYIQNIVPPATIPIATPIQLLPSAIPDRLSTMDHPFTGTGRYISIYNPNVYTINIKGISIYSNRLLPSTNLIKTTYRQLGDIANEITYKGGNIGLSKNMELAISSIDNFWIDRIMIAVDNTTPKNLTFFIKINATGIYHPVIFKDVTFAFITIDLLET